MRQGILRPNGAFSYLGTSRLCWRIIHCVSSFECYDEAMVCLIMVLLFISCGSLNKPIWPTHLRLLLLDAITMPLARLSHLPKVVPYLTHFQTQTSSS